MKKIFLLFAFVLCFSFAYAQDYEIVDGYITKEKIFENTGLSADDTYQRMTIFFGSYFNNVTETCKVNTPTKLLYKFIDDVADVNKGLGVYHTYYAEYELQISIKDNRMRMVLTAYNIDSNDMLASYTGYNPADAFPVVESHSSWETGVSKKQAETIFNGLMSSMSSIERAIEKKLYEKEEEEEW